MVLIIEGTPKIPYSLHMNVYPSQNYRKKLYRSSGAEHHELVLVPKKIYMKISGGGG